jgi:hypothetical protein
MTAADAAMASGATYRSFIILSSLLGDIRRCRLKIGFRPAYSRQLAQASGQTVPSVYELETGPQGIGEFQIPSLYGTSWSRPCVSSRSAPQ